MISAAELVDLQAVWAEALPETCILQRRAFTSDGYDTAGSVSYAAFGTVACRVQPTAARPNELVAAGQLLGAEYADIALAATAAGTALRPQDRVQHVSATWGTATWEIEGATQPRSYAYGLTLRAVRVAGTAA